MADRGSAELESFQVTPLLDSLHEGLQVISPDWRYLYVNDAVARHGKKSRSDLVGRTMMECYPGLERTPLFAVLERCMRGRTSETLENEFVYDDGERAWFELRIQPCQEGLIVLSLEATERKRLERALRQAHKLRALGQMAIGIAHDLKNILNPLSLNIQLLRRGAGLGGAADERLTEMLGIVTRGAQVIDRLRDFGRQTPTSEATLVDMTVLALEAIELCRPKLVSVGRSVHLEQALTTPAPARVNAAELVSALVNLIVNAFDAMPEGGSIAVRTGVTEEIAWVEVQDTGTGMPPEVESKVFEPFFTTKGEAGTGMGLAMVYAFVKRHAGTIALSTAPGKGTTFTLRFPGESIAIASSAASGAEPEVSPGTG